MKLTREDTLNLIDTLLEWEKHPDLGPKEMGENDAGLDSERYTDLMQRLIDSVEPRENDNVIRQYLERVKFFEDTKPQKD